MNTEFYGLVKRLREYRLDRQITLAEIEAETGITQQRMKRIEQGISPITVAEVETLLTFYGADSNEIIGHDSLEASGERQRKVIRTMLWAALLVVLGYGGYQGYALVKEKAPSEADRSASVAEMMERKPVGGEQKVSELLAETKNTQPPAQAPDPAAAHKKQAAAPTFRLAVYGDRPYHSSESTPLTPVDFQLFPVSDFRVGQGIPQWISDAAKRGPTAIDVANVDILKAQSRSSIQKEIASLQQKQIQVMGYGPAEHVFRPRIVEKNGVKYGIMAYTRVVPAVEWKAEGKQTGVADAYGSHIIQDIRRAKQEVDVLLVTMYWGREGQTAPEDYQRALAHDLLDAGADMLIGHRTPARQAHEIYKGKYIFYNIGSAQLDVLYDQTKIKELALVEGKERHQIFSAKK
ncbi:CapA family protein [Aneurinibacillus sp. BA2021]|nr:CapA family protein [Aneurinibacillus sp. BA2021]